MQYASETRTVKIKKKASMVTTFVKGGLESGKVNQLIYLTTFHPHQIHVPKCNFWNAETVMSTTMCPPSPKLLEKFNCLQSH